MNQEELIEQLRANFIALSKVQSLKDAYNADSLMNIYACHISALKGGVLRLAKIVSESAG
jgi:hypothetical protein